MADKYQSGFDQPLLTTMFVDRKLTGVQAVQTLSRLNRTHPANSQDDLFVLDFANDAEDIRKSFQRYYETTLTTPTDPNLLYTAEREVMEHQLLVEHELADFAEAFAAADRSRAEGRERQRLHAEMNRHTEPAVKRFVRLQEEDADAAESFRAALRDFVRMYAFLAQIVPFTDSGLERLFQYGKLLLNRLPNRKEESDIDLSGTAVEQFRLKQTGVHDERLTSEGAQVLPGFSEGGSGTAKEQETGSLQELIDELNKKHGGHAHPGDMGDPLNAVLDEPEMANAADANGEEDFGLVFDTAFGAQLASVLAAAHSGFLVHRDIKPPNVMVGPDGAVKLLDFGIPILLDPSISRLTRSHEALGSAPYIAPEVCTGGDATARTDLYALGCLMFEALTGRPPFTGARTDVLIYHQVHTAPPSLGDLRDDAPAPLAALLADLLSKEPADRPADADEVLTRLAPFLPAGNRPWGGRWLCPPSHTPV